MSEIYNGVFSLYYLLWRRNQDRFKGFCNRLRETKLAL